ncbi:unnamed protein product, partial [Ectocarpus fasciculatus]
GHRSLSDVGALIDEQLADESITGDKRAQWLVAKAVFEENNTDDEPNAFAGRRALELAFAAAESEAVRFWVLNEHAGRLAAMGAVDELESLLAAVGDQFSTQEQLASQSAWRSGAARWASDFERANDRQAVDRQQELITSLQQRLDAAVANSDTNGQARYGALVTEAQR